VPKFVGFVAKAHRKNISGLCDQISLKITCARAFGAFFRIVARSIARRSEHLLTASNSFRLKGIKVSEKVLLVPSMSSRSFKEVNLCCGEDILIAIA
jgi:hypothetical protein